MLKSWLSEAGTERLLLYCLALYALAPLLRPAVSRLLRRMLVTMRARASSAGAKRIGQLGESLVAASSAILGAAAVSAATSALPENAALGLDEASQLPMPASNAGVPSSG
jgi:hypothetical protein